MKEYIQNFLIVSVSYITAYSLTLGFVAPVQKILLSGVAIEVGLLFCHTASEFLHFIFWAGEQRFILCLRPT